MRDAYLSCSLHLSRTQNAVLADLLVSDSTPLEAFMGDSDNSDPPKRA